MGKKLFGISEPLIEKPTVEKAMAVIKKIKNLFIYLFILY